MDDFDFYKEFLGVDIAKVDQVGEVIGRAIAALMKGMIAGGLNERQAIKIISDVHSAIFKEILIANKNQDG